MSQRLTLNFLISILITGCNSLFYHPDDEIWFKPNPEVLTVIPHTIATPDGEALAAQHILSFAKKRKGLVVQFHGNAQNLSAHQTGLFWLLEEGYDLFVFDYRGYGKSTGKPTRSGTILDGIAVIKYLESDSELKKMKKNYWGQSLGGAVLYTALANVSDASVSTLIIDSSFSSYRAMARLKLADVWLTWALQWPLSFLVSDELSPETVQIDPKIPIHFFHNPSDPVVPIAAGRRFYEYVGSIRKSFTETPHTGHCGAFIGEKSPVRTVVLNNFDDGKLPNQSSK